MEGLIVRQKMHLSEDLSAFSPSFKSQTPRYFEQPNNTNTPGPGAYGIPSLDYCKPTTIQKKLPSTMSRLGKTTIAADSSNGSSAAPDPRLSFLLIIIATSGPVPTILRNSRDPPTMRGQKALVSHSNLTGHLPQGRVRMSERPSSTREQPRLYSRVRLQK